jgi:hypothetical protein
MSLVSLVVILIVVGVLLWVVNTQLGPFIAAPILKIINVVVIIAVVLWLLSVFGLIGDINTIRAPRVG